MIRAKTLKNWSIQFTMRSFKVMKKIEYGEYNQKVMYAFNFQCSFKNAKIIECGEYTPKVLYNIDIFINI